MADDKDGAEGRVEVFANTRMADPAVPDDVMHGRRFLDPTTGRPASIVEILERTGMIRPAPDAAAGKPGTDDA